MKEKTIKIIKFGDEKHILCASKLFEIIRSLYKTKGNIYLQIEHFVTFVDEAPPTLVKNFLDLLDLQGIWKALLKKHTKMLLPCELIPLPNFSVFNQLMGFYRYVLGVRSENPEHKLKFFQQAMEQGSINAMMYLGDFYINQIQSRQKFDLVVLLKKIECLANLFLTPGHIIAADIYLAVWATALSLQHFENALYHLFLAELLQEKSAAHINNAYFKKDFKSASMDGAVFRSADYKGQSISENIISNWIIYTERTHEDLDLKPIMQKAVNYVRKIQDESKKSKTEINISELKKLFILKFQENPDQFVCDYLFKKSPFISFKMTAISAEEADAVYSKKFS